MFCCFSARWGLFARGSFLSSQFGWLVCLVLCLGTFWRVVGLSEHVTYIDELIVLADGRWSSRDAALDALQKGPIEYAYRLATEFESSFAPGQFLVTYFLLKDRQLSWASLVGARQVSCCAAVISLFLLCGVARRVLKIREPIILLPSLVLLACSQLAILNAHLAYPYSVVILGGVLSFVLLDVAVVSGSLIFRALAVFALSILPWFNYQLFFYSVACCLVVGVLWLIRWVRDRKSFGSIGGDIVILVLAAVALLGVAWFVKAKKMQWGVAWWVASFVFQGDWAGIKLALVHAWQAFGALLSPGGGGIGLSMVIMPGSILSVSFVAGVHRSFGKYPHIIAALFLAGGLILGSYFLGSTPLSPTRHSLVFLPLLSLVFLIGMDSIVGLLGGYWQSSRICMLISLWGTAVCGVALCEQIKEREVAAETWDARALHELAQRQGIDTIVASHWDYSKVQMMLSDIGVFESYKVYGVTNAGQVPAAPFILAGQNPDLFKGIYELPGRSDLVAVKELERMQEFDFEPSALVTYWPNRFSVWVVVPPSKGGERDNASANP